VWHRVECTEDSLSMNISLIGLSWADHVADATRHAMWRHTVRYDRRASPVTSQFLILK
jgi:hypothetical protein